MILKVFLVFFIIDVGGIKMLLLVLIFEFFFLFLVKVFDFGFSFDVVVVLFLFLVILCNFVIDKESVEIVGGNCRSCCIFM